MVYWYNTQTIIYFDPFMSPEKAGIGAVPLDLLQSTVSNLKVKDVGLLINW